ncbi:hypothetical protein CLV47_101185 [Antricoccus suffuscus]|uniref:DUF1365 family protein n=1 Tax=Antricoccus suffuscus TaxID=1629062 RepID=A0A2T1A637_9ACTN|nr:DUF1365 domain-containing protein [Antricoccus suffuscus]PRZ44061.1 hypothetical protein CLV47_101185 [Antricoccus suffuscus]
MSIAPDETRTEQAIKTPAIATPARYDVQITHRRREPLDYRFTNRSQTWLVDLDALPQLPRFARGLCRFDGRDHLSGARRTIRANLDDWLADAGQLRPARVLMLAQPRVLGYVFNPLTVFYCYDRQGRAMYVVAEVANTYGGRQCYLLHPDEAGRAQVDKDFYVSPFNPIDGGYEMLVPQPGPRLTVTVTLRRPGALPFTAAMTGARAPSAPLWSALTRPLLSRATMFQIKRHGITLYIRGLRPTTRTKETGNVTHTR